MTVSTPKRDKAEHRSAIWVGNLRVVIDWLRWEPGASVFIPCLDPAGLKAQMRRRAKEHGYTLRAQDRIENGLFGVRFWRVE